MFPRPPQLENISSHVILLLQIYLFLNLIEVFHGKPFCWGWRKDYCCQHFHTETNSILESNINLPHWPPTSWGRLATAQPQYCLLCFAKPSVQSRIFHSFPGAPLGIRKIFQGPRVTGYWIEPGPWFRLITILSVLHLSFEYHVYSNCACFSLLLPPPIWNTQSSPEPCSLLHSSLQVELARTWVEGRCSLCSLIGRLSGTEMTSGGLLVCNDVNPPDPGRCKSQLCMDLQGYRPQFSTDMVGILYLTVRPIHALERWINRMIHPTSLCSAFILHSLTISKYFFVDLCNCQISYTLWECKGGWVKQHWLSTCDTKDYI